MKNGPAPRVCALLSPPLLSLSLCLPVLAAAPPAAEPSLASDSGPSRPSSEMPGAFADNDGSGRAVLTDSIFPDLRVFVDLDPRRMP